jgi:hypothetical protein
MASFNKFSQIANALTPFLSQSTTNTAQSIIDDYAGTAPRETGRMAESGYIVTAQKSTYDQVAVPEVPMTKEGKPYKDPPYLLPEVATPDDPITAKAAIAMSYSAFVELGTVHQSPQPSWYPAIERAASKLEDELSGFEDYLEGVI